MELIYISNRSSEEGPLTLDTIPVEILHHICTFFCDHCDPMKKSHIEYCFNYNPNKGKKDLLNLCLTSRALCTVAQGVLFHHFSFGRHLMHSGPLAFRLVAASFLQALSNKLHLRAVVKELKIETNRDTRYPKILGFDSLSKASRHSARLLRTLGAEIGIRFRYHELQRRDLREAMVQLMIALCPNVSKMEIQIPRYWAFDKLTERNLLTQSSTNQQPLSSLRTLDALVERLPTDNCRIPHELCNMAAFGNPSEHALVAGSASRLETLKCTLGALENATEMPRLEVLKLDVRGSYSDLKSLFTKIPKLRELIYCSSNKHGPLPIEINAALRNHRETLEVLAIHFWKVPYGDLVILDPFIDNTEFRLGLMSDFTNLKVLIVDALRIREAGENRSSEEPFQTISDTIPESLEMLCVHAMDMVSQPDYQPLFEVADRVREGRFKALKHVLWTRKQNRSYPNGLGYLDPQHDSLKSGAYHIGPVDPETAVSLKKRYPILMTMQHNCYV
ncbi:unnamed protein product [Clonostachys solani]|uniref:Uncharacterized protein n=1 Tax=Clonostachys solani TaxID=160281 RepID=A0A9N9ZH42_9HYPO|nr:unnamed protein product [Clonostachys solani]